MIRALALSGCFLFLAGCAHERPLAYESPYDLPLVSPGVKFLALPAAVQNTVRAETGSAEIDDIGRFDLHGGTFYKVWFRRAGSYPPLYVAPDGSVLNSDLTISLAAPVETYAELTGQSKGVLSLADLPAEVVRTIRAQAKTLEIGRIAESTAGEKRVYEVYFKDSKAMPMLKVDQDGKIIESNAGMGKIRKPPGT